MERPEENPNASSSAKAVGATPDAASGEGAPAEEGAFLERHFRVLLIVLVGAAIVGGAGVAYTQYGWVTQAAATLPFLSEEAPTGAGGEQEAGEYGSFTELKGLVVNPARSGGGRYLAVSLAFETTSSAVKKELEDKEVVVRDAVLDLLSGYTAEELSANDQRDALKKELLQATNDLLSEGNVKRLYFTQFVLQ